MYTKWERLFERMEEDEEEVVPEEEEVPTERVEFEVVVDGGPVILPPLHENVTAMNNSKWSIIKNWKIQKKIQVKPNCFSPKETHLSADEGSWHMEQSLALQSESFGFSCRFNIKKAK